MLLAPTRTWQRRDPPADVVAELEQEGRYSPLIARLLVLRGLDSTRACDAYFARRLSDLHRPSLMLGMEAASRRLAEAIRRRERILIHGDYDVDGSTAAALLAHFVRQFSHQAVVWIPHRQSDGYGLSPASLEAVREHRAQVMVTVDCGISDQGWARRIEQETGCAVIITDHHLPQDAEPECTAICNPNRRGCPYPDKHLAGVGVAWKLAWATAVELAGADKLPAPLREFLLDALGLVALGTVADCAPLDGENRILVHHGLKALLRSGNPGLRVLVDHAKLEQGIDAGDIGWKIGPLLNASGRVGSAMANIRLFTATERSVAEAELKGLVAENEERRRLTQMLVADLVAAAEADPALGTRSTLVFAGEGWHPGIVGIVAGRLVERFGKPAAVIAVNEGQGKGSLRSVPQVHLAEALEACRSHLVKGGGHAMAAGLTIEAGKVADFSAAFEAHVAQRVPAGSLVARTAYDAEAGLADLDAGFFEQLDAMQPFGMGNEAPVLRLNRASFVSRPRPLGAGGDHLKGALTDPGGGMRELLAWRVGERMAALSTTGARFDVLVRPENQRWRGGLQSRLIFVDGRSV